MQNRLELIEQLINDAKNSMYTTVFVKNKNLYERVYATYDKPDYDILLRNLTEGEIKFVLTLGVHCY
jgi:hypothetical protein